MTPEDVATFERCISVGGVALFPADTVYGLATEPDSREGFDRLYALKGRPPREARRRSCSSSATWRWPRCPSSARARAAALERLLPGPVTLIVPNPTRRFPLACGPAPDRLGVRVPALTGALAPLAAARWPVLQSSANPSGGADARRLDDVDPRIRAGVDLQLDGGELPGTPSTVIDLTGWEDAASYEIVRQGALSPGDVAARLH